ncbi:MAG: hypothetical protein A2Y41_03955 [Spirochaetes bacterium GWB1_36_13]|nr:MAG: hypothetical protein A2Y41_03955 [Spirochaetes bacterium GWB1_36_13]
MASAPIYNKLKELIEKKEQRERTVGGEVFVVWGMLNIVSIFIFRFLWQEIAVWIIMVGIGVSFQVFYLNKIVRKKGYKTFWTGTISRIWLSAVFVLPLVFYVYPFVFHLYSLEAVLPLILLFMGTLMIITGMILKSWTFKTSALIFVSASIFSAAFPLAYLYFYPSAFFLGFVIPGIWSFYEQRKNR